MDKVNRALTATEDNAIMIAELRAALKKSTGFSYEVRKSTPSLGIVNVPKGGAAIIAFDGNAVSAAFGGQKIATGMSPIIAILPPGKGELAVSAARPNVRAFILYNN